MPCFVKMGPFDTTAQTSQCVASFVVLLRSAGDHDHFCNFERPTVASTYGYGEGRAQLLSLIA